MKILIFRQISHDFKYKFFSSTVSLDWPQLRIFSFSLLIFLILSKFYKKTLFVNCPVRNNSLPNRSAATWNILPHEIDNAKSVKAFKARLDNHVKMNRWRESIYVC